MPHCFRTAIASTLGIGVAALMGMARADVEVVTPDGRRVILKDDGTWRTVDNPGSAASAAGPAKAAAAAASAASAASAPEVPLVPADLEIVERREIPGGCQFDLKLTNQLGYELTTFVFDFRALRRNGVVYNDQSLGFSRILPGDEQQRTLRVFGLGCAEIGKIEVAGGDRCTMGDLNRFTDGKGLCLARIRVKPHAQVTFEK